MENVHSECQMQKDWGQQFERNKLYDNHIKEGEKQGGYRDRLAKMEVIVDGLMRTQIKTFWAGCIGGFIGGLIGRLVPWLGDAVGRIIGLH